MSKKKKSPTRAQYHAPKISSVAATEPVASKPRLASPDAWSGESRGAVFLTVGWMFSLLATMLSLLLWLGVWWYNSRSANDLAGVPQEEALRFQQWASVIWTYATLFALTTGLITLVLGVVVNRIRNKPAPSSIRRLSGIVGALPWAIYVAMFLMSK